MPLIDPKPESLLSKPLIREIAQGEDPSMGEVWDAMWRNENTIGSYMYEKDFDLPSTVGDPNYDVWQKLTTEEKLDDRFLDLAHNISSDKDLEESRRYYVQRKKDLNTIAEGGWRSLVTGLGAGVFDPINLLPIGGMAVKAYRSGNLLKGALATATVGGIATGTQEYFLHKTQMERNLQDTALNMSASMFLSGVLGAGFAKMSKAGQINREVLKAVEDSLDTDKIMKASPEIEGRANLSAGKTADDVKVKGKIAQALLKAVGWDPLSRTITSLSNATRRISNSLAENPIWMEVKGYTGQAVESFVKTNISKHLNPALMDLDNAYKAYKTAKGTLSRRDFNNAVSKELRNPSPDADPHIKKSAQSFQRNIYEPLKKDLIANKLLPEDIDVVTAKNYLNRVWSPEKIKANRGEFVNRVSNWLKLQNSLAETAQDYTEAEIKDIARQIARRIETSRDGILPYDWKMGEGTSAVKGTSVRGPLKKRLFNIPDEVIEDFLENDIEKLAGRYVRQVVPDIQLTKAYGDLAMTNEIKEIMDDWDAIIALEKNASKVKKLEKMKQKDVDDIKGMRDRIRGVYTQEKDPDSLFNRALRAGRNINYLRFMGGVTIASIPDMARLFMAEGFANTFRHGLKPLITNLRQFKVSAREAKMWGVGSDALVGGRSQIIADVGDVTLAGTKFERGLQTLSDRFGKYNLMDYWTGGMKQIHAVTMQTRVFNALAGKGSKRDLPSVMNKLDRLGISEANAKRMLKQAEKHGGMEDGVFVTNWKKWDDDELAQMWGNALRKESDRVIVVPGQEKALFMSSEMGKSLLQFKSFMLSATQRMAIAGIQGQDKNAFGGFAMLTSLGMASYAFKQWDAGRELSDDPRVWVMEGIDRSGATGILMEVNNTLEKMSDNHLGLRPLLGISTPASRFASRNKMENLLGPTGGSLLSTIGTVTGGLGSAFGEAEWNESDTRALRRLLPYQNLSLLRQGFDKIEESVNEVLK